MNNLRDDLERISDILQILSFYILVNDFNNTDLMKYLEHQDNLLNEIINQNKEIIKLLGEENGRKHQKDN